MMRSLMDLLSSASGNLALRRLANDQRGSVAIWVGIALTVFIGCAGLAIDTARGYMVKARLSQALDAAALAGAKSLGSGHVKEDVQMFFAANFPASEFDAVVAGPVMTPADPDAQVSSDNTLKVSAQATIDATLMSVLGFKTMTVAAEATAVRGLQGLDVVIAIDVSGSMCDDSTCSKIKGAQNAAKILVDTVYSDPNPKTVTIGATTYDLLNIGIVPWSGKVNVTYNSALGKGAYSSVTPKAVPQFTNPFTNLPQSVVYVPNNSEVQLLSDPGSTWKGGVYARYFDNADTSDDADMKLGYGTFGGKGWMAYEPVPTLQGEPVNSTVGPEFSSSWTSTTGGVYPPSGPVTTNWYSSTPNKTRNCFAAYWNDKYTDPANHPKNVPDAPSTWVPAYPIKYNSSDDFSEAGQNECFPAPQQGIMPLYPVKDAASKLVIDNAVANLYTGTRPDGSTVAAQGLFWAWEVLMPGEPFNQAKASVPFNRTQAIVLLTDGESTGYNGDAYKAVFGPDTGANSTAAHGALASGGTDCDGAGLPSTYNNLNGRLEVLSKAIKGADPEKGVKIFVVQYRVSSSALKSLLRRVATKCEAPYYYEAGNDAALEAAFKSIAATLSVLRLKE